MSAKNCNIIISAYKLDSATTLSVNVLELEMKIDQMAASDFDLFLLLMVQG